MASMYDTLREDMRLTALRRLLVIYSVGSVALATFFPGAGNFALQGLFGAQHGLTNVGAQGKPTDHLLMVGATLATVPPILIFIAAQRYFVRGIVMSGLKGAGV